MVQPQRAAAVVILNTKWVDELSSFVFLANIECVLGDGDLGRMAQVHDASNTL